MASHESFADAVAELLPPADQKLPFEVRCEGARDVRWEVWAGSYCVGHVIESGEMYETSRYSYPAEEVHGRER